MGESFQREEQIRNRQDAIKFLKNFQNHPMKLLFATLYKRKAGENDEAGDY